MNPQILKEPPTREEVAAFLEGRGYRSYPVSDIDRHDRNWQTRSGVICKDSDGDVKRGYFDVREWRREEYRHRIPGIRDGYEVGATFETPHGWLKLWFYSLHAEELLARLPALEAEIRAIQEHLMGERGTTTATRIRPTERRPMGLHGAAITYTLTSQGLSVVILRGGESKSALLEPHNALRLAEDIQREYGGRE